MRLTILDTHLRDEYLNKYKANSDVFIETGTWLGDNAELMRLYGFKRIHTIEGNEERYNFCRERFKDNPEIKVWQGDSPALLARILMEINMPATIWLDSPATLSGHPILDELKAIRDHSVKDHTIFIDDRRLFRSEEWGTYISEEAALDILREINPNYHIHYLDGVIPQDIICATTRTNEDATDDARQHLFSQYMEGKI